MVLGSATPALLFYTVFSLWSFAAAVVVVLTWSALIFGWHRRRTGQADVFSATAFGFACVQAAVGLLTRSPGAYLAVPSAENVLYGTVLLGSALAGRPLLALYARRLYPIPRAVQDSAAFRRAFVVVSAGWLAGLSLRAALRLWLLAALPLELYLLVNTVAGWPFNLALVAFTAWYPLRALERAGLLDSLPPLADVEEAVEEAVPGSP